MSGDQHLHSLIGKEIYACKKRFYQRLKDGADINNSIAQFVGELRLGLMRIAENTKNGFADSV